MKELAKALSQAQSEISHAIKDGTNPHFKSEYSTITAIWDAARGPLTRHGLAITQTQRFESETIISITTLMHLSGEHISSELPLLLMKKDMQQIGSALSYARRYQLASIAGICSEDDDGEGAMDRRSAPVFAGPAPKLQPKSVIKFMTPERGSVLKSAREAAGVSQDEFKMMLSSQDIASPADLTEGQFESLLASLKRIEEGNKSSVAPGDFSENVDMFK